jgi:hypothetical protein
MRAGCPTSKRSLLVQSFEAVRASRELPSPRHREESAPGRRETCERLFGHPHRAQLKDVANVVNDQLRVGNLARCELRRRQGVEQIVARRDD